MNIKLVMALVFAMVATSVILTIGIAQGWIPNPLPKADNSQVKVDPANPLIDRNAADPTPIAEDVEGCELSEHAKAEADFSGGQRITCSYDDGAKATIRTYPIALTEEYLDTRANVKPSDTQATVYGEDWTVTLYAEKGVLDNHDMGELADALGGQVIK